MDNKKCKQCKYYSGTREEVDFTEYKNQLKWKGQCRRHAPVLMTRVKKEGYLEGNFANMGEYPIVFNTFEACGDFEWQENNDSKESTTDDKEQGFKEGDTLIWFWLDKGNWNRINYDVIVKIEEGRKFLDKDGALICTCDDPNIRKATPEIFKIFKQIEESFK